MDFEAQPERVRAIFEPINFYRLEIAAQKWAAIYIAITKITLFRGIDSRYVLVVEGGGWVHPLQERFPRQKFLPPSEELRDWDRGDIQHIREDLLFVADWAHTLLPVDINTTIISKMESDYLDEWWCHYRKVDEDILCVPVIENSSLVLFDGRERGKGHFLRPDYWSEF